MGDEHKCADIFGECIGVGENVMVARGGPPLGSLGDIKYGMKKMLHILHSHFYMNIPIFTIVGM